MRKNTKGFTLAELLIVVAIIAVLVAISIPIFTSQLKRSRLAVDHSAIRDAYALIQVANNTESVEIDGDLYSYSQLNSKYSTFGKFVLSNDCNSLIDVTNLAIAEFPNNSYFFKESGCEESNSFYCDTCSQIGTNISTTAFPAWHHKGYPIYVHYSCEDNRFYLGLW